MKQILSLCESYVEWMGKRAIVIKIHITYIHSKLEYMYVHGYKWYVWCVFNNNLLYYLTYEWNKLLFGKSKISGTYLSQRNVDNLLYLVILRLIYSEVNYINN